MVNISGKLNGLEGRIVHPQHDEIVAKARDDVANRVQAINVICLPLLMERGDFIRRSAPGHRRCFLMVSAAAMATAAMAAAKAAIAAATATVATAAKGR